MVIMFIIVVMVIMVVMVKMVIMFIIVINYNGYLGYHGYHDHERQELVSATNKIDLSLFQDLFIVVEMSGHNSECIISPLQLGDRL